MIQNFFAAWGAKIVVGLVAASLVGGGLYLGKQRYDESKREEGRQEIRDEWSAANEAARLAARSFELRVGANNRKLDDARHAELKRLRVVVSDQQKALNETIDLLRNRSTATTERVPEQPAKTGDSVSEPRTATTCIDEVARLGDIAIRNYEAASSCADQVIGLQNWIIKNQELHETTETR